MTEIFRHDLYEIVKNINYDFNILTDQQRVQLLQFFKDLLNGKILLLDTEKLKKDIKIGPALYNDTLHAYLTTGELMIKCNSFMNATTPISEKDTKKLIESYIKEKLIEQISSKYA